MSTLSVNEVKEDAHHLFSSGVSYIYLLYFMYFFFGGWELAVPQLVLINYVIKCNLESRPAFGLYAYSVLGFLVSPRIMWIKNDIRLLGFLNGFLDS